MAKYMQMQRIIESLSFKSVFGSVSPRKWNLGTFVEKNKKCSIWKMRNNFVMSKKKNDKKQAN